MYTFTLSKQRIIEGGLVQATNKDKGALLFVQISEPWSYTVSLASPSHSLELIGVGLVQVLSLVALHWALQVDREDQGVHPPIRTQ